jgi:MFS family permease
MSNAFRVGTTDRNWLSYLGQTVSEHIPVLLRDRSFRAYWSAQTVSMFGDQISALALPLAAVLVLHASAAEMGYLTALIWLPSLIFGVHAGALTAQLGRHRTIMIAADIGRFALLASVPVCYVFGVMTFGQLCAVAFAVGVLSLMFIVSDSTLFVSLVREERYVDGQSLVYGSRALALVGGPSIGGLLIQLLSAPLAIASDALSYLASALFLRKIPPAGQAVRADGKHSAAAGAKFVVRSPSLRAIFATMATINFFTFMFSALYLLYITRSLHIRPGLIGIVLGAAAFGGVAGSLVTRRLVSKAGLGPAFLIGCITFPGPLLLVPLAAGPKIAVLTLLFIAEFASGIGVMVLDISIASIFATVIPDAMRSRVMGAFQAVNNGTRPLGAVLGGTLGSLIGLRPTLLIATIGGVIGFVWLLPSPIPRFHK